MRPAAGRKDPGRGLAIPLVDREKGEGLQDLQYS